MRSGSHISFFSPHSLPFKICLIITLVEGFFLALFGSYFLKVYHNELDQDVKNRLIQAGILMSQQSLQFYTAAQKDIISQLVGEKVLECFVINPNGTILFTEDQEKKGQPYSLFLKEEESALPVNAIQHFTITRYRTADNHPVITSFAPLTLEDLFFGSLFIRISAERLEQQKQDIFITFCAGAFGTILFTLLGEILFLYRTTVPRLKNISTALERVERQQAYTYSEIPTGPPDQIGIFLRRINTILKTLTTTNENLRKLYFAGEQIGAASNRMTLYATATSIVCRFFNVQQGEIDQLIQSNIDNFYHSPQIGQLTSSEDKRKLFLCLPNPENTNEFLWAQFSRKDNGKIEKVDQNLYLEHLSRIFRSAIRRISAFEEIAQAEERYRELFSSAVEGIFRATPGGQFEVVNPAMAAMSGYDSPEDMIHSITDIGAQFYAEPRDRGTIFETMLTKGKIVDYEAFFKRKDGSIFPGAISCHRVENDQGGIVAYEGRVVNIEERKLRELAEQNRKAAEAVSRVQMKMVAQLEQNEQQLQQSLEEKEILLREIYHRTKNNMLVIISMLKLQLAKLSDQQARMILEETENRIRAMAMVHEKLYQSENLVDIDLASYLTDLTQALTNSLLVTNHITIQTDTQPVPISIDHAVPLGLAVNEIITNSLKHGFPGEMTGTIRLTLCQRHNNMIELTIKDSGIGLPEDFSLDQPHSFGLQIAQNLICKQLGGTITMTSEHGTQTLISFTEPERLQRITMV